MANNILVVDDEPDMLLLMSRVLQKGGYVVCGEKDGSKVLSLTRQILPDLIILDIYLPFMNGDDLARELKKDEKLKHIPVILISSTTDGLGKTAAACGAQAYLPKPFNPGELLGLVKRYCPRRESADL